MTRVAAYTSTNRTWFCEGELEEEGGGGDGEGQRSKREETVD